MTDYEKLNLVTSITGAMDWTRIQRTMEFLGWNWFGVGVPTNYHLVKEANKLGMDVLTAAIDKPNINHTKGTGGLEASATIMDGRPYITIRFVLDSYDNYDFEHPAIPE